MFWPGDVPVVVLAAVTRMSGPTIRRVALEPILFASSCSWILGEASAAAVKKYRPGGVSAGIVTFDVTGFDVSGGIGGTAASPKSTINDPILALIVVR